MNSKSNIRVLFEILSSSYVETDALLRSGKVAGMHEKLSQRMKDLCTKSVEQTIYLVSIYEPYTFYSRR